MKPICVCEANAHTHTSNADVLFFYYDVRRPHIVYYIFFLLRTRRPVLVKRVLAKCVLVRDVDVLCAQQIETKKKKTPNSVRTVLVKRSQCKIWPERRQRRRQDRKKIM